MNESFTIYNTNMSSYTPEVKNNEFHYHSGRIYQEILKLGITDLYEREQEYARRMNAIPTFDQKKMKPPTVSFEDTDLPNESTLFFKRLTQVRNTGTKDASEA
jgi:hypothetical protein